MFKTNYIFFLIHKKIYSRIVGISQYILLVYRPACSENLEQLVWWSFGVTCEKYHSAIGQHLLDNNECASNYKEENFSVLIRTCSVTVLMWNFIILCNFYHFR